MPKGLLLKTLFSRRMLMALIMGYAAGLPLELTGSVLKTWMRESGADLTVIGLMALVGLPYTLKFFQAPLLDRYTIAFLGRRRGWLLVFQLLLIGSIAGLGMTDPVAMPWLVAVAAFAVTLFSASQDIVIDAYRREDLADQELGLGSSLYVAGYRTGMLLASGGGLILADHLPFSVVYALLAACLLPALLATVLTPEPPTPLGIPRTLREAVVAPFTEYFSRTNALWILAFILFYKLGDTMAGAMAAPFYIDLQFTKTQIGTVVKLAGFQAITLGLFAGGILILKVGIHRSLWVFGFLQALSTAGFAALSLIGNSLPALAAVIGFENLTAGMGTAAYTAFMASITHKKFTATQYALLSSLMGVPRVFAASITGWLAEWLGWTGFFTFCTLIAAPGLLLLFKFAPLRRSRAPEPAGTLPAGLSG